MVPNSPVAMTSALTALGDGREVSGVPSHPPTSAGDGHVDRLEGEVPVDDEDAGSERVDDHGYDVAQTLELVEFPGQRNCHGRHLPEGHPRAERAAVDRRLDDANEERPASGAVLVVDVGEPLGDGRGESEEQRGCAYQPRRDAPERSRRAEQQ